MELTAVISVIRHGEKDDAGELTQTGSMQAKTAGLQATHLEGDVILMHSGVGRVTDTLATVARHIHLNEDDPQEYLEEEAQLQSYVSPYLHYLYDPGNKGKFFSSWDAPDMDDAARNARMQDFLDMHDSSGEPDVYPAPLEMAQRIARVVRTQIDFALLTESSFRTNFINGTHEPVLMSFVTYLLNGFQKPAPDVVEQFGGSVGYAEGIDVLVYQSGTEYELSAVFRNTPYPLDAELLSS